MSSDSDPMLQRHALLDPRSAPRRRWPWFPLCFILGLACAGGVYAWLQIATLAPSLSRETSGAGMTANDREMLTDLLAT